MDLGFGFFVSAVRNLWHFEIVLSKRLEFVWATVSFKKNGFSFSTVLVAMGRVRAASSKADASALWRGVNLPGGPLRYDAHILLKRLKAAIVVFGKTKILVKALCKKLLSVAHSPLLVLSGERLLNAVKCA